MAFYLSNACTQGVLRFFRDRQVGNDRHLREEVLRGGVQQRVRFLKRLLARVLRREMGRKICYAENASPGQDFFFLLLGVVIFGGLRKFQFFRRFVSFENGLRRAMVLCIFAWVAHCRDLAGSDVPRFFFFSRT